MTLDLTLAPIYRIKGQEIAGLPGLLALTPPQNAARGREKDRLIVYLLLTGNSTVSIAEYLQVAQNAANIFYQTSGALTSALRTAVDRVNKSLLERNMSTSARGQYTIGWLILAALRDTQCTLSLSGSMHVYRFSQHDIRHIHEPVPSGKGLGANQTANIYYAQTTISAGDRLLFFGKAPGAWDSTLTDPTPSSLDAMRRRLTTQSSGDLNAVLIQATNGKGVLNLLSGITDSREEKKEETSLPLPTQSDASSLSRYEETFPTTEGGSASAPSGHILQPSAYAIPLQHEEEPPRSTPLANLPRNTISQDFPTSIPRVQFDAKSITSEPIIEDSDLSEPEVNKKGDPKKAAKSEVLREPYVRTRQTAKVIAAGIQSTRRISETLGARLKIFLPRLLPNTNAGESFAPSNFTMLVIAIIVPLVVVVMAFVMYSKYGRNPQYEAYLGQAKETSAQAASLTNSIEQRESWKTVLLYVDKAEEIYHSTSDTILLRQEAEANLDKLMGITRLQFNTAFSTNLGIDISRMASNESDLFLLNAANGEVLRAKPANSGHGFELDTSFNCKPGVYGNYTVGPLVDILAMPTQNSINATLLGVDAGGNLLYCAPNQVAQAIPLPPPDTNWGRVTAFTMDGGNLYVLDSPARAVWVYTGKDGTFVDRPYFFFGGQTPEKQDVIDLAVTGDDLYMLHADGHLSTCSYSRIESVPTRCEDPSPLTNPFPAYQDSNLFESAHFTQLLFNAPPDQSILLLDADTQGVLRFTPRSLELQEQIRPTTGVTNPVPPGPVGAVSVGPNHVLYLAVDGQVYFAPDMP
jgi:hypothetical protein